MKTYEELQKEWNESTYGNEFAYYVYSIDKETIERLEKENKELRSLILCIARQMGNDVWLNDPEWEIIENLKAPTPDNQPLTL